MPKATIRDVAARAGVSTATVSRALSGARPVSPEVADLVRRAAGELGYSGNGIASALRRNRTDTVGMVVPSIANPFFTALVEGVEHALQQAGRQLVAFGDAVVHGTTDRGCYVDHRVRNHHAPTGWVMATVTAGLPRWVVAVPGWRPALMLRLVPPGSAPSRA